MRKTKTGVGLFFLLFSLTVSCLRADSPDFKIGYEFIQGKHYFPEYSASWQWDAVSSDWKLNGSYAGSNPPDSSDFSFVFMKFGKTEVFNGWFSAGFETGLYFPFSYSSQKWDMPFFSTGTSPSTIYNWEVAPSTYSARYNSAGRKLFVLPFMGKAIFDAGRFLKFSLGAGVYVVRLEVTEIYGEEFKVDYQEISGGSLRVFRKGDVQEYKYWREETKIIPAVRASVSSWLKLTGDSNLDFSVSCGWLRETDFLSNEYNSGGGVLRDRYVIGGLTYGISAGVRVLF